MVAMALAHPCGCVCGRRAHVCVPHAVGVCSHLPLSDPEPCASRHGCTHTQMYPSLQPLPTHLSPLHPLACRADDVPDLVQTSCSTIHTMALTGMAPRSCPHVSSLCNYCCSCLL